MRKNSGWTAVAIDCGNSSVRVVLGIFDGNKFTTTVVGQTPHREIMVNGVWHWDILFLFEYIKAGLKKAHDLAGNIDSAGIATWGIDHGLIAPGGLLLANPFCYRNSFGQTGLSRLSPAERRFMFDHTGIQCDKINSVFQMLGYRDLYPEYWQAADKILLIPDLLNFLLTGEMNSDASITSTTQLFNVVDNAYSLPVLDKFELASTLFPPMAAHGQERGILRAAIAEELGINRFPVVSVPAHDTAAAVAAIPSSGQEPLFISSGTWSLVGIELPEAIINDAVFASGLANESGALGSITLLKNSAGLFIAQRLKKEGDLAGNPKTWDQIVREIDMDKLPCGCIDPNDEAFFNPSSMRKAIRDYVVAGGGKEPAADADYYRITYESLAESYRQVIAAIENATGKTFDTLNIIGGGSQNTLLNQLAAQAVGKTVVAGPVEATSLGILGVQLLYEGSAANLADIRAVMRNSCLTTVFKP